MFEAHPRQLSNLSLRRQPAGLLPHMEPCIELLKTRDQFNAFGLEVLCLQDDRLYQRCEASCKYAFPAPKNTLSVILQATAQ
jgi:hypothetical protein